MAVKAGEAFLELSMHDQKFKVGLGGALKELRSAAGAISAVGAGLAAVGGAITATFGVAAHTFANFGNQLSKMSIRTGVGVKTLSLLAYAAGQSGANIESLETIIKRMQLSLSGLGGKGKQTAKALMALGVDAGTLRNLLPSDALHVLLDALANIQNPTQRAAIAMRLFGKSGTEILPLIGHWKQLSAEAEHFNLTVSAQSAQRAEKLESAFGLLRETFRALRFAIGDAFGDGLTNAIRSIAEMVSTSIRWVKANQSLVAAASTVGKVILGVGVGLAAVGAAIPVIMPAIEGLKGIISGLSAPFGIVTGVLGALASTVGFLITPFGAVVGLVLAAAGAFVYFSGTGSKIVKFLSDKFSILKDIFLETFSAISDALSGGDIGAAANVLWAGLKLAWLKGTEDLRVAWADFSNKIFDAMTNLRFNLASVWADIAADFKTTWAGAIAAVTTIGENLSHNASRIDPNSHRTAEQIQRDIDNANKQFSETQNPFTSELQYQRILALQSELAALRLTQKGREELRKEMDAAHNQRVGSIKTEGDTAKSAIEEERKAKLKAIEDARKAAAAAPVVDPLKAAREATEKAQADFDAKRKAAHAAKGKGFGGDLADDPFQGGAFAGIADTGKGITRSTFGGKLAEQIFGAASSDPVSKQQLAELRLIKKTLREIQPKLAFSFLRFGIG